MLEKQQGKTAEEMQVVIATMAQSSEHLARLKEVQNELLDALVRAGDLEARLETSETRCAQFGIGKSVNALSDSFTSLVI